MNDSVSRGLNSLAIGLRPYVAARVETVLRDSELAAEVSAWDAQSLMVFMWDRWNELFRNELSFVERSLISELREFRNRWAHQNFLEERDVYRVLDDIERLLTAINSAETNAVSVLRAESLRRLWMAEQGDDDRQRRIRVLWPYLLCGCSAVALDVAILSFGRAPWSWLLASLVLLAMMRVAYVQAAREAKQGPGPHECTHCGRIVYSIHCPYCLAQDNKRQNNAGDGEAATPPLTGSRPGFQLPHDTHPGRHHPTQASAPSAVRKV